MTEALKVNSVAVQELDVYYNYISDAGGKALAEKYDVVGDVRGKGLMFCMEMVSDRATKTPLDKESIAKIYNGAYDAGVMVRISGNNLICSPPLIITEAETQTLLDGIEAGLRAATANG